MPPISFTYIIDSYPGRESTIFKKKQELVILKTWNVHDDQKY